jgi:HSP20 family protein
MEETQSSFWRYCATAQWEPSVNICESAEAYHIAADLAGVKREDIDVQVHAGRLLIRGQRCVPRPDVENQQLRVHHMEIEHGSFCRELDLPGDVNAQQIVARYKDGVLWIDLPKHQEQREL